MEEVARDEQWTYGVSKTQTATKAKMATLASDICLSQNQEGAAMEEWIKGGPGDNRLKT